MYYSEEDIQPAVDLAQKIFGRAEQYHTWSDGQVMVNVAIMTRKYGKILSGDLLLGKNAGTASVDLQKKLDILADSIGHTVFLTDGDYEFSLAIARSQ